MAKKKKARKSVPKGKKRGPKAAKRKLTRKGRSPGQRLLASLKKAKRTTLTDYPGPRVLDGEVKETAAEPAEEGVAEKKEKGGKTDWHGPKFR